MCGKNSGAQHRRAVGNLQDLHTKVGHKLCSLSSGWLCQCKVSMINLDKLSGNLCVTLNSK